MTIPEMISVLEAARDGKPIQSASVVNGGEPILPWRDEPDPLWGFDCYAYRVKSQPREWWLVELGRYPAEAYSTEIQALAVSAGRVNPPAKVLHVREVME